MLSNLHLGCPQALMLHRNLITPTEVFIAPTKIAVGAVIDVVMRSFSEHVDESILEYRCH